MQERKETHFQTTKRVGKFVLPPNQAEDLVMVASHAGYSVVVANQAEDSVLADKKAG